MEISSPFNRFFHKCILTDLHRRCDTLTFRHLMDTRTGGAFVAHKYPYFNKQDMEIVEPDIGTVDELKQLLKLMNLDYPISKDEKESTKDISNKDLVQHIEFAFLIASQNGISMPVVEREWAELIKNYRE